MRYAYLTFSRRVSQLANTLENLGVRQGDTVAVMDWDSHRYLECFFGVPMMGAVLVACLFVLLHQRCDQGFHRNNFVYPIGIGAGKCKPVLQLAFLGAD
jgi:long-subunit acyl-CoA synthetase (AMP-forming)